jgi:hypothetical protein
MDNSRTRTELFRFITEAEFHALSLKNQHRYLIDAHARLEAEATLLSSLASTLGDDQKPAD